MKLINWQESMIMDNDLKNILMEIEEIIAKLGNYDIGKAQFSDQGRKELKGLFKKKINIAKSINERLKLVS